jgi:Succinate dehydrogenase/fumarate reductase, flavoprotein subunit
MERPDVLVIGGGNAGYSAALAAAERGRRVVLLETADPEEAGGNSYFTAGATRIAHAGTSDLLEFVDPDPRHAETVVPPYPADEYAADLARVTDGRNDPDLTDVLVRESNAAVRWLAGHGLRYRLMYERQSYRGPEGYLFWGGLHIGNTGGGVGLMRDHAAAADRAGVEVRHGHRVTGLLGSAEGVDGVTWEGRGAGGRVTADSVILACGGFEADAERRARHLGEPWRHAKVRGTRHNTGELLDAALALGAARGGDWSTCHSTAWDAWAPDNESNREFTNRLTRQSYPLGIVVNAAGRRFVDEGADFRNYTYAKYGREILAQPGSLAFQLFDATTRPWLRAEEYEMPGASEIVADSLEELAARAGIDANGLVSTVAEFNAAIVEAPFDPNVKDGRASNVAPPKSNWALALDTPPFYAYPVTCGITFTFGGLRGDVDGRVLREDGSHLPGLFAVGEALGGLFSGNYPGGSGLAAGAVFGRRAGSRA